VSSGKIPAQSGALVLKKVAESGENTRPPKSSSKAGMRRFVIIWHRRLGLASALLVLILSITGLILNRTVEWQLDTHLIKAPWIASWYGLSAKSDPVAYNAGTHWVTVLDDQIYINRQHVGPKDGEILGAVTWDDSIIIRSETGLTAYSTDGQLYDQIGNDELPGKISRIGLMNDGAIAISTDKGAFVAVNDLRQWTPASGPTNDTPDWSTRARAPDDISTAVIKLYNGRGLPISRLLLDIHSGRFFGGWGVYAMDAAAIFLMLLTVSGFYNWWVRR